MLFGCCCKKGRMGKTKRFNMEAHTSGGQAIEKGASCPGSSVSQEYFIIYPYSALWTTLKLQIRILVLCFLCFNRVEMVRPSFCRQSRKPFRLYNTLFASVILFLKNMIYNYALIYVDISKYYYANSTLKLWITKLNFISHTRIFLFFYLLALHRAKKKM